LDEKFSLGGLLFDLDRVGCLWLVRGWLGVATLYMYRLNNSPNFGAVAAGLMLEPYRWIPITASYKITNIINEHPFLNVVVRRSNPCGEMFLQSPVWKFLGCHRSRPPFAL